MKPARKSRLLRVLFGVTLSLALFEGGWRIYLFRFASHAHRSKWSRIKDVAESERLFSPHPYLCYCLNPRYRSRDGLNRHNRLGFRGAEIEREKPEGRYRIVCLGGSSTYDERVKDYRLAYPAQLEQVLKETYGRHQVQVINAGVPGYNSWESLISLQLRVFDIDPDLVVIYHATNDVHTRLIDPATYRRDNTGWRRPWREESHWWDHSLVAHYLGVQLGFSQLNSLGGLTVVDRSKDLDRKAALAANPPIYFQANLENMVALCRARGVGIVLTSWAYCPTKGDYASTAVYQRGFRENNAVSKLVADQAGVPFFDLAAVMPQDDEYWLDGRHNNAKGARKKAELIARFLDKIIG